MGRFKALRLYFGILIRIFSKGSKSPYKWQSGMFTLYTLDNEFIGEEDELPTKFTGISENSDGNKVWWLNGLIHREDGPAVEHSDGTKEWFVNGKRHREDGPAIIYCNGTKMWYWNGKLHRTDGPATEYDTGFREWFNKGNLHRIGGPATEWFPERTKHYFINNKQITKEQHDILYSIMKLKGLL